MIVQKKADDARPSRSMGAAAKVLKLERSGWVKSIVESTSTDDGEKEGTHR